MCHHGRDLIERGRMGSGGRIRRLLTRAATIILLICLLRAASAATASSATGFQSANNDIEDHHKAENMDENETRRSLEKIRHAGRGMGPADAATPLPSSGSSEKDNEKHLGRDILILTSIDGSFTGLDGDTGELLWRRDASDYDDSTRHEEKSGTRDESRTTSFFEADDSNDAQRIATNDQHDARSMLAPLLATTTTTRSSSSSHAFERTLAVPWTDGARVSLTASDVTVTARMDELVARAPFVDARGRRYASSRKASAFLLDAATGSVVAVEPVGEAASASALERSRRSMQRVDPLDAASADSKGPENYVWLGRVDETISLYEPRTGALDAQVSTARIMGMQDMMLGRDDNNDEQHQRPNDKSGDEHGTGSIANEVSTHHGDGHATSNQRQQRSTATRETIILTTPSGNLALANVASGSVLWVASSDCFPSTVAFAIDAATGASLPVRMVPDAVLPNRSAEYVVRELERQMGLLTDGFAAYADDEQPVVGAMPNGQLYAMSLANPSRIADENYYYHHHSPPPVTASNAPSRSFHVVSGVGRHPSHVHRPQLHSHERHSPRRRHCRPGSADFPACVVDIERYDDRYGGDDDQAFLAETNGDGDAVGFYRGYAPDLYPEHYFTLPYYDEQRSRERRRYRRLLRLMGSWLPPMIALIFVLSFEMGRRKRQRAAKAMDNQNLTVNQATNVGLIKVFDDSILGYGGHGTVVYKGSLEDRLVAVKRMLRAYHASADREISLLIESDGHANVVRYFLKEVRGDFVYLALELCDLSLHDLILVLGERQATNENSVSGGTLSSTKVVLSQIASGVHHLHSLRIVHRDMKPQNILLAASKGAKGETDDVFQLFLQQEYVAKISDMGLGKQLMGQSSFGASIISDSIRGQSNGAQSSVAGVGPGSVGWQAPEVMTMRMPSDASARSEGSGPARTDSNTGSASPSEMVGSARTSRSVDIFSLGCIFYSTLVPGSHAFGEWWEREANIMHNRPNIAALRVISADAHDLVDAMIQRDPLSRPTARQVCDHPFFWRDARRLSFFCDFSDRIESDATDDKVSTLALAVERKASDVVGLSWDANLDAMLVNNVVRFRTYDPSSVRDLLRLIRNKSHHFDELPDELKAAMNNTTAGFLNYFEHRFPCLLTHCYNVCRDCLSKDDQLCERYDIVPYGRALVAQIDKHISTITEQIDDDIHREEMMRLDSANVDAAHHTDKVGCILTERPLLVEVPVEGQKRDNAEPLSVQLSPSPSSVPMPNDDSTAQVPEAGEIVIWEASTAAKTFNCRGWSRSDDEWERRVVDSSIRRRDNKDLIRCSEDPRFRTRLCNHWSVSFGTTCPMRDKKKCIFAHGPVELRVKEGKLHRWGKLVDINGNNTNRAHSGGEDTYGIAKSIEAERTVQGKCKVENKGKPAPKKPPTSVNKKKKAAKASETVAD